MLANATVWSLLREQINVNHFNQQFAMRLVGVFLLKLHTSKVAKFDQRISVVIHEASNHQSVCTTRPTATPKATF